MRKKNLCSYVPFNYFDSYRGTLRILFRNVWNLTSENEKNGKWKISWKFKENW